MATGTLTNGRPPSTVVTTSPRGPKSPRTNNTNNDGATLTATILSAYDLPIREPPSYITIQVGDVVVKTGPPAQRHKDRNSFKFNRETVSLRAPHLPDLYASKAIVTVAYPNLNTFIQAEYELKQLKIHETVWLILQLEGVERERDVVPPTLRLQFTLSGPYRAEIGFFVNLFEGWFKFIDLLEDGISQQTQKLPKLDWLGGAADPKYLLIPAAPLLAILVVSTPVVAGALTVTLPVALPVLVVIAAILGLLLFAVAFIYGSSRTGRSQIGSMFAPLFNTLLSTKAGQTAMYQTGPRPNPVSVARVVLPDGVWSKLILSLMIDGIGSASYLLPVVGEITDLGWAPIQTTLIMAMYEGQQQTTTGGEWLKYASFIEEILPFTDIVPTATAGWLLYVGMPLWFGTDDADVSSSASTTVTMPTTTPRAPSKSTNGQTVYETSSATGNRSVPMRFQSGELVA